MDDVERLIEAFEARPTPPVCWKLDALMDLHHLRDRRIVPFLLQVLHDRDEPAAVRTGVVRLLRAGSFAAEDRASIGGALAEVVASPASPEVRIAAALTLADFTDVDGVPGALGAVALDRAASLDLRYSAFTSLEQAGPTPECAVLLRRLAKDEAFGPSARSLLARWQLA